MLRSLMCRLVDMYAVALHGRPDRNTANMSIAHEILLNTGNATPEATTNSISFIGNATLLIRYAGFTILTDPTFVHMHEKVDIGYGMSATRLTNPVMEIQDLPPLDFIILSHFHGDHFDQVAERDLPKALPIMTTADAAQQLHERRVRPMPTPWTGGRPRPSSRARRGFSSRPRRAGRSARRVLRPAGCDGHAPGL